MYVRVVVAFALVVGSLTLAPREVALAASPVQHQCFFIGGFIVKILSRNGTVESINIDNQGSCPGGDNLKPSNTQGPQQTTCVITGGTAIRITTRGGVLDSVTIRPGGSCPPGQSKL